MPYRCQTNFSVQPATYENPPHTPDHLAAVSAEQATTTAKNHSIGHRTICTSSKASPVYAGGPQTTMLLVPVCRRESFRAHGAHFARQVKPKEKSVEKGRPLLISERPLIDRKEAEESADIAQAYSVQERTEHKTCTVKVQEVSHKYK